MRGQAKERSYVCVAERRRRKEMRIMWKNSGDCPCSSILVFLPALVRISHIEKICPNPAVTLKSWHLPPGASMMQYVRFSKVSRCLGTPRRPNLHLNPPILAPRRPDTFETLNYSMIPVPIHSCPKRYCLSKGTLEGLGGNRGTST